MSSQLETVKINGQLVCQLLLDNERLRAYFKDMHNFNQCFCFLFENKLSSLHWKVTFSYLDFSPFLPALVGGPVNKPSLFTAFAAKLNNRALYPWS